MTQPETAQQPVPTHETRLSKTEPGAAGSDLADPVQVANDALLQSGIIPGEYFRLLREYGITKTEESVANTALRATIEGGTHSTHLLPGGFNDSTTSNRFLADTEHLRPAERALLLRRGLSELRNRDHYKEGIPLPGNLEAQPSAAVVILDPEKLDALGLSDDKKKELFNRVQDKLFAIIAGEQDVKMDDDLKQILSTTLVANNTVTPPDENNPKSFSSEWKLPYDDIAGFKALSVLLGGGDDSGEARQGALRLKAPDGREIIVAVSGYDSAVDEMLARIFGEAVIEEYSNSFSRHDKVTHYADGSKSVTYSTPDKIATLKAAPRDDKEALASPVAIIELENEHGGVSKAYWYNGAIVFTTQAKAKAESEVESGVGTEAESEVGTEAESEVETKEQTEYTPEDIVLGFQQAPLNVTVGKGLELDGDVEDGPKHQILPGYIVKKVTIQTKGMANGQTPPLRAASNHTFNKEQNPFPSLRSKAARLLGESSAQQ
jgi:hypothetical protein